MSSTKYTHSERASVILENHGTNLPPEIATSLLSAVGAGNATLRCPEHLTFGGPAAVAVAANDPAKAELIAGRAKDIETQWSMYNLAFRDGYERILPALAQSTYVADHDLRIAIHDSLLEQKRSMYAAVTMCPVGHIVEWLDTHEVPSMYPYRIAGQILCDSTDHDISRFLRHCEKMIPETDSPEYWTRQNRHELDCGLNAIGEILAKRGESERVVSLVENFKYGVRLNILTAAWNHAETATGRLTKALLSLVAENFDELAERKAHATSNERYDPWIPRLIKHRTKLGYDEESLRLLADAAPEMLIPILQKLANGDKRRDLLVELALGSKNVLLVQLLLERRYCTDGSLTGPVLRDGVDYHKAVAIAQSAPGYRTSGHGVAPCIPSSACIDDVITATKRDGRNHLYECLFEPRVGLRGAWQPDVEDFAKLIANTDHSTLSSAVYRGAERIRCEIAGEYAADHDNIVAARKYLNMAIEHVRAEHLCGSQDTLAYVATRLGEIFADDPAGFEQALHLAAASTRPFGEVIRAAKKLR